MDRTFIKGAVSGTLAGLVLGGAVTAWAAAKTYQYTGSVTEVSDKMLSVDKNGEVWEFALDADSKGSGSIKKGDKVTVTYRMFATRIEKK